MATRGHYALFRNASFVALISIIALFSMVKILRMLVVGWFIYAEGGSLFHLGGIGLIEALCYISTNPFGGWLADRRGRKKQAATLAVLLTVLSLALCLLLARGYDTTTLLGLYVVTGLFGLSRGLFASGALTALLALSVSRRDFQAANGWSHTLVQILYLLGPVVVGVLYAHFGAVAAAASLIPAIILGGLLLLLVEDRKTAPARTDISRFRDITLGFSLIFGEPTLRRVICFDFIVTACGSLSGILPVFAKDILHTGPDGLGLLRAALPAGALLGAAVMAHRQGDIPLNRSHLLMVLLLAVSIGGFALSSAMTISIACLALCGFFETMSAVLRQNVLRQLTDEAHIGRVTSTRIFFNSSAQEISTFQSSALAALMGAVPAAGLGAAVVALTALALGKTDPAGNEKFRNRLNENGV